MKKDNQAVATSIDSNQAVATATDGNVAVETLAESNVAVETLAESNVAVETLAESNVAVVKTDKISLKEKVFYGIGGFMDGGGVAMMSCVMVAYMTKHLGIALQSATLIFMLAKLWDAITDPIMAFITDNTRSKFGRRKPYLFFGGISLILCIFLVFMPVKDMGMSIAGITVYIIFMYLLWNTCSTVTQVPYCSMASDISPSFKERNSANTVKLIFVAIASGIAYVVPLVFIEGLTNQAEGGFLGLITVNSIGFWLGMSIFFGLLFGGGLVLCALFVKERIKPTGPVQKFNFKQFIYSYSAPYKNKSYRAHIAMYASAFMCMDIISALAVFYATDVWRGHQLFGMNMSSMFIVAPMMVSAVVMFPIARKLMDKKGKAFAFRVGLPFYIVGGIMMAAMDPSWAPPVLVPIVAIIMGLGFGGAQMMPWIIFPDTVDVEQMATGSRQTGTYSGMMTLARKVAGALGVGLTGVIIGAFGYREASYVGEVIDWQPQEALVAIRFVLGITVAIFITIALIASFRYKITTDRLQRIRYFIEARKQQVILSEEEIAERDKLIKLLYGKNNCSEEIIYKEALKTGDFSKVTIFSSEEEAELFGSDQDADIYVENSAEGERTEIADEDVTEVADAVACDSEVAMQADADTALSEEQDTK